MSKHQLENSYTILSNVHDPSQCLGEHCTIHNMSDHHMRPWPQHWRSDRGVMERICPHGVGHPDPDNPWPAEHSNWIHGCDGCCATPKAEDEESLVDALTGMADIVDETRGSAVVTLLSGALFREAADVITELTEQCEYWERQALVAFELLAGEPFDADSWRTFDEALGVYRRGIDWIWPKS